jgi:hypothetical protein
MNTVEERLWSYIDGSCSNEERKTIGLLIIQDAEWKDKYEELLSFDQELSKMELDEPSMAFTYNVMEGIRNQYAQQPLKAGINKNIIRVISWFFVATIVLMLVLILSTVHVTPARITVHLPDSLKLPDLRNLLNSGVMQGFLCLDLVLAMFLTDAYLRRKRQQKEALRP